jgi:hypothetical protein
VNSVPAIQFEGDRLRVVWSDFAAGPGYELFKAVKRLPEYDVVLDDDGLSVGVTAPARFAAMLGVAVPELVVDRLPWIDTLFDDQRAILDMALAAKRFACWSDCGLGKTIIGLEYARQVSNLSGGGRVLIVTLNEIVPQWIEEAKKFYGDTLPVVRLNSREEMRRWCAGQSVVSGQLSVVSEDKEQTPCIAVVNYEKFNHDCESDQVVSELRSLAGIVLDESSRLKTGGGKQKWALIKSAKGIQYKLSLTATPAPNELMEFASQASFLERMRSESIADAAQQIIWTYFTRDPKTHRWTIKKHARAAFFEWMASWSIYVRDPKKFGWRLDWSPPPEPVYLRHEIKITAEQRQLVMDFNADPRNVAEANVGSMFAGEMNAIVATKLSQAAKGFLYEHSHSNGRKSAGADRSTIPSVSSKRDRDDEERDLQHVGGEGLDPDGTDGSEGDSGATVGDGKPAKRRSIRAIHSLKPAFVVDLIVSEMLAGHQVLVWTIFDEETAILMRLLKKHPKLKGKDLISARNIRTLTGSTKDEERVTILSDFRAGQCPCLISRAAMLGYGMNLQFVTSTIFSGWTFSYEQFYQAIRRFFRHGQTERVRVHLPVIPELEGQMYDAIVRKQQQHEEAIAEMEANYVNARKQLTGGREAA